MMPSHSFLAALSGLLASVSLVSADCIDEIATNAVCRFAQICSCADIISEYTCSGAIVSPMGSVEVPTICCQSCAADVNFGATCDSTSPDELVFSKSVDVGEELYFDFPLELDYQVGTVGTNVTFRVDDRYLWFGIHITSFVETNNALSSFGYEYLFESNETVNARTRWVRSRISDFSSSMWDSSGPGGDALMQCNSEQQAAGVCLRDDSLLVRFGPNQGLEAPRHLEEDLAPLDTVLLPSYKDGNMWVLPFWRCAEAIPSSANGYLRMRISAAGPNYSTQGFEFADAANFEVDGMVYHGSNRGNLALPLNDEAEAKVREKWWIDQDGDGKIEVGGSIGWLLDRSLPATNCVAEGDVSHCSIYPILEVPINTLLEFDLTRPTLDLVAMPSLATLEACDFDVDEVLVDQRERNLDADGKYTYQYTADKPSRLYFTSTVEPICFFKGTLVVDVMEEGEAEEGDGDTSAAGAIAHNVDKLMAFVLLLGVFLL